MSTPLKWGSSLCLRLQCKAINKWSRWAVSLPMKEPTCKFYNLGKILNAMKLHRPCTEIACLSEKQKHITEIAWMMTLWKCPQTQYLRGYQNLFWLVAVIVDCQLNPCFMGQELSGFRKKIVPRPPPFEGHLISSLPCPPVCAYWLLVCACFQRSDSNCLCFSVWSRLDSVLWAVLTQKVVFDMLSASYPGATS